MRKWIGGIAGSAAAVALVAFGALVVGPMVHAAGSAGTSRLVATEKLPNVPGKSLTAILVSYPPGGSTPEHYHAGSVFAYVVSGSIRSQVSGQGPVRVYHAGESFFEPPGGEHFVSANGSDTKPASLLAVFVADDGAKLTTMGMRPGLKPAPDNAAH